MFDTWSLKKKLIAFALFEGLCLVIVGGFGIFALRSVTAKFEHIVDSNLPNAQAIKDIMAGQRDVVIAVAYITGAESNREMADLARQRLKASLEIYEKGSSAYLNIPFAPGEEEKWNEVAASFKTLMELAEKIINLSDTGKPEDLEARDRLSNNEFMDTRAKVRAALDKLFAFQSQDAKNWVDTADETQTLFNLLLISTVLVGFSTAIGTGTFLALQISRSMSSVAEQLAAGADEVTGAATEISATSEQLSASATEQASSLQETAASIEEMSSMVKQNSDNASRSSEIARSGQSSASKGKVVVDEMIVAINDIDSANKEISEVVKVIGQIGNKTKIIDDIVFKTQLLSFNASVEAARAGEHGKGFAVVAEEVGNLAQMSGNAAKEISDMLEQSLERVERMIATSKQKVEVGLNVGKRCGEVLDELVGTVSEVNGKANEIASACEEQSRGINEITRAMNQLDQVTQQNASASQQAASAAEQLSRQAEVMHASVAELMQVIQGSHGEGVAAPIPRKHNAHTSKKSQPRSNGKNGAKLKAVKTAEGPGNRRRASANDEEGQAKDSTPSGQHHGFDEVA